MRITSGGAIIPSSQQRSEGEKEEEEEEINTDSRNLTTECRRNVTPPGESDIQGAITGGNRFFTSRRRGGSLSPEPSTSEKDISSGRKEVKQENACKFCRRNPQYRKRIPANMAHLQRVKEQLIQRQEVTLSPNYELQVFIYSLFTVGEQNCKNTV